MADEALLARIETLEAAVAEFRAKIEPVRAGRF
jgi:hypothetical protein